MREPLAMSFRAVILRACFSLSLASLPLSAVAAPDTTKSSTVAAHAALTDLAKSITFEWAAAHPLVGTALGLSQYDGDLDTPGTAALARDAERIATWKRRLAAIDLSDASLVDRDDARLLGATLTTYDRDIHLRKPYEKDYSGPAQAVVGGLFTQFQQLPLPGPDGRAGADGMRAWERIISRLEKAPTYIRMGEQLVTHPGHLQNSVGAQALAGAPDFLSGALTTAATAQLPTQTLRRFIAARDATLAEIAKSKAYIDAHLTEWPENFAIGREAYDAMLRDEQLLPFTAADVERMAHDELAHGWAVQTWIEDLARQNGTTIGVASGGGLAPGGAALVGYYRDRIAELTNFMRTHAVVDVPAWLGKIEIVETPKFLQPVSPGASMNPPLLFSARNDGFYFITPPTSLADAAERLDPNEDFDRDRILSTGAHEAMPGHFLQFSIARRHPDFIRKIQGSGVFAEGWAFYGEELFAQLGLFGNDLDGRYFTAQWERVRGARAIVDPALAAGTMTIDQAADFFARESGFPPAAARAAVSGYALSPGYVISYTVGRYQLEALLAEYRHQAGARASLLDFHDRLLSYGTTPFSIVGPELLADLAKPLAEVRANANF